MHAFRARFGKDIIAEFLPPRTKKDKKKVIIFCSGMPSGPSKNAVLSFFSRKGFWTFTFRYRGSWESGGRFLKISPEKDVLEIVSRLNKFRDVSIGKTWSVKPSALYVVGHSFGGPAALLVSKDKRVSKVIAVSPVIDWKANLKRGETIDWTLQFTRKAFGEAYRFSNTDWNKLKKGIFYNPMGQLKNIEGSKVLIIHAKDDTVIPWQPAQKLAKLTGSRIKFFSKGGHLSSLSLTRPKLYGIVASFLRN